MTRPNLNAVAIVPPSLDGAVGSTGFHVLRTHSAEPKFLFYLVQTRRFIEEMSSCVQGALYPAVRPRDIASFAFSLPSLAEQQRIVAKIEELFSELDQGVASLKTAQAQLKVYRQALLKHAFEGKLTARWRAENPDQLESAETLLARIRDERAARYRQQVADWEATGKVGSKPKAPISLGALTADETVGLPALPDGWAWERLGNISELMGGVTKGKDLTGKDFVLLPYLRVANVQDGFLDLREVKEIAVELRDKDKYRLEIGDVLYTEGGDKDKLGRGAVWNGQIDPCIHQNHIFRARLFPGTVYPMVLALQSQTRTSRRYFFRHAKQTTNLASINLRVLGNLPVSVFSQHEQCYLLQELETRISEVDQLDQTIVSALQQSAALRQSILKKAFSGQLVAQDANDEPAAVLLERIKAERNAAPARGRRSSAEKPLGEPAPSPAEIIPFPVWIAGISQTDLHAGILARAYQHHEQSPRYLPHFGHVKAEKIVHLVEAHLGIDLGRAPVKAAAGPNDYPRLKKVESRAEKANWFSVKQRSDGGAYVFVKRSGFDALLGKTRAALGDRADAVDRLLELMLPLNTRQAEVVATLYAAWNNLLLQGRSPDDEAIVAEAREDWHASKLAIEREKFFRGLQWMREKGLVPAGRGRPVGHKGGATR